MHEGCAVACVLIDRKLSRKLRLRPEHVVDLFWRDILAALLADPWLPLETIVSLAHEPYAARTIADRIRCPIVGWERMFLWNFDWHQREVLRLHRVREEFIRSVDFIYEHCEGTNVQLRA